MADAEWEARYAKAQAAYALTPAEIESKLENSIMHGSFTDGETWENEFDWYSLDEFETVRVEGVGSVTTMESRGGEGQGDQAWKTIKIRFEDTYVTRFFKKPGWHASHDGTYYDGDLFEVTPVQHVVTIWEEVRSNAD